MKTSLKGIDLTKGFESCRLIPYKDSGGIWTNGWGNTNNVDPNVTITPQEADDQLVLNLQYAEDAINKLVHVVLTQKEFDACVDLTFNIGMGNFRSSTLLKLINLNKKDEASLEFIKWDYIGKIKSSGLERRRIAETKEFKNETS